MSSFERARAQLIDQLTETRARTLLLIAPVSATDLRLQHDPLMGPILWDLGHIAEFEHLWLVLNLSGDLQFGEMPGLFNPFEHPRKSRGQLPLPGAAETLQHLAEVRSRALQGLLRWNPLTDQRLLNDGFVYNMVLQHEQQHDETILQTLQLKQGEPYPAPRAFAVPAQAVPLPAPGSMVRFPGGRVVMGTAARRFAYDNERPAYELEVRPFHIDVAPVTNGQFLEFMGAGGYQRAELWSAAGGSWRAENPEVLAPKYWIHSDGEWQVRRYDRTVAVAQDHPVMHVCYYEAEAYATWAGKRLPTEVEWECAASWDPAGERKLLFPWGDGAATVADANVDQLMFDTAPVGSYPRNISPIGCYGMIGDTWEWTSTDFTGYPGYETFPYREYSEVFFGADYKVLRGGSWATRTLVVRNSFRNWDYPIRRQIFSGFRCARDE